MRATHVAAGRLLSALLLAAVCLHLPGPVSAQSSAPSSASPLQHVRVQLKWRHQFQFAGYYAAIEQGYYRDAGLDVELIEYSPGVTPIDQLMGGNVDFAVADTGALIYRATGVPLVALAAIFQHSPSVLITRDDGTAPTLGDLRFKRLMLSGGYMNAELTAMLQNAGVKPADLDLVPEDTSITALVNGKTDAYNGYSTNEPYFLKKSGIPFRVFQPRDHGVDFYGDTLFTTEAKIAAEGDLVEDFRHATLKGWAYAVAHPAETVDLILTKYNTQGKTRDHLMFEAQESIKLILPNVVPIGYMNAERWTRIEETFQAQGRLSGAVDMGRFLYPSDELGRFLDMLRRHKAVIAGGVALLVAALLLMHIASLRVQIRARTRELEAAKKLAEEEARTDILTGLPNRRHFYDDVARDISRLQRFKSSMCVIVADIDHFKTINDRYGHAAGDEALKQASAILLRNVRAGDMVARIGGEEFAFCCLDTPADEARTFAERLRLEMERTPVEFGGQRIAVTFSLGVAEYREGQSLDDVLHDADQALYEAKQSGRNKVCAFSGANA
ncbi:MAG: GGDEF domain-containing protein [Rhodospirillales bacterium]|nr:GGDEF domain-containing protein [Rhodospirillales bacterium]MBO6785250.1 GGDEF domain-containing protein [Rhodospirillales bacterium]